MPVRGGQDQELGLRELAHAGSGGDLLVAADLQQVDDGLAPRGAAALGDLVDLLPVHAARRR